MGLVQSRPNRNRSKWLDRSKRSPADVSELDCSRTDRIWSNSSRKHSTSSQGICLKERKYSGTPVRVNRQTAATGGPLDLIYEHMNEVGNGAVDKPCSKVSAESDKVTHGTVDTCQQHCNDTLPLSTLYSIDNEYTVDDKVTVGPFPKKLISTSPDYEKLPPFHESANPDKLGGDETVHNGSVSRQGTNNHYTTTTCPRCQNSTSTYTSINKAANPSIIPLNDSETTREDGCVTEGDGMRGKECNEVQLQDGDVKEEVIHGSVNTEHGPGSKASVVSIQVKNPADCDYEIYPDKYRPATLSSNDSPRNIVQPRKAEVVIFLRTQIIDRESWFAVFQVAVGCDKNSLRRRQKSLQSDGYRLIDRAEFLLYKAKSDSTVEVGILGMEWMLGSMQKHSKTCMVHGLDGLWSGLEATSQFWMTSKGSRRPEEHLTFTVYVRQEGHPEKSVGICCTMTNDQRIPRQLRRVVAATRSSPALLTQVRPNNDIDATNPTSDSEISLQTEDRSSHRHDDVTNDSDRDFELRDKDLVESETEKTSRKRSVFFEDTEDSNTFQQDSTSLITKPLNHFECTAEDADRIRSVTSKPDLEWILAG